MLSNDDGAKPGKKLLAETAGSIDADATPDQNATFVNTKQHVADQQKASLATERFANTKQNIALINDPKSGPRFTLTKKESGHVDEPDAEVKSPTDEEAAAEPQSNQKAEAGAARRTPEENGQQTAASPAQRPIGLPSAEESPEKLPIDSSKTFVGPNGTYYDEAWRWMDWRGIRRSWNWAAALSLGHWFAYRRLYLSAGAFVLWLGLLAAALVNNVHAGIAAGLLLLSLIVVGSYANFLYLLKFRRAVVYVTEEGEGSYDELQQQLAKAGGVSSMAVWLMACFAIIGVGASLALTFFVRGSLLINIWPL